MTAASAGNANPTLAPQDIAQFLDFVLPEQGVYFVATQYPNGKGYEHTPCHTIPQAVEKALALDAGERNAYFGCASYKQESYEGRDGKRHWRTKENVSSAKCFWCDIDCGEDKATAGTGYATTQDAIAALRKL